jgi:hypothetical protein
MGRRVLAIDPSGNFEEGKGTTGYVLMEVQDDMSYDVLEVGQIQAAAYQNRLDYWGAHIHLLRPKYADHIVMEDFRLYNHAGMSAATQSHSLMETPRLLGLLEHTCHLAKKTYTMQMAAQQKPWSDSILATLGLLERVGKRYYLKNHPVNDHQRSAFKHFLIWWTKEKSHVA